MTIDELFFKKQNVSRKWNVFSTHPTINFAISLFDHTNTNRTMPVFSNPFFYIYIKEFKILWKFLTKET